MDLTPSNRGLERFTLKAQAGILLHFRYFAIKSNRKFLFLCLNFSGLWRSPLQKGSGKHQQLSVKCTTKFFDAGSPDAKIPEELNEPLRTHFPVDPRKVARLKHSPVTPRGQSSALTSATPARVFPPTYHFFPSV